MSEVLFERDYSEADVIQAEIDEGERLDKQRLALKMTGLLPKDPTQGEEIIALIGKLYAVLSRDRLPH
jgi:hypothetical protein